jgi:hypothetical protein
VEIGCGLKCQQQIDAAAESGLDQAEGLHRAALRRCRRRAPDRDAVRPRQGMRGSMEISALDRRAARPAAHRDGKDSAVQIAGTGIVELATPRPRRAAPARAAVPDRARRAAPTR